MANLTLRQQALLLTGVRGPDSGNSEAVKPIIRFFRFLMLVPADENKLAPFMLEDLLRSEIEEFKRNIDGYSFHFINHLYDVAVCLWFKAPTTQRGQIDLVCKVIENILYVQRSSEVDFDKRLWDNQG
jgi:hypothetical protein